MISFSVRDSDLGNITGKMILFLLSNSEYKVPTIIPNQNNHSLYGENYKKLMKSIK